MRSRVRDWTRSGGRCQGCMYGSCALEAGEPLPPGAVGEIQVRSDSVMAGYLPDSGDGPGVFGRLVSNGRRRIPRRRRLAAHYRPGQGNDQGAGISGGARRDRGGAARASGRRGLCGVRGARHGERRGDRRRGQDVQPGRGRRARRARRGPAGVVQAAEPGGVRARNTALAIGKSVASSAEGALWTSV